MRIAAIIPIVLMLTLGFLSGCVSQDKYDLLAKNCEQEHATLADNIELEKAACAESKDAVIMCNSEKNALQTLLNRKNTELTSMRADAAKIAQAREKTGQIAKYRLLLKYFDDAYGPGQIPNTAKVQKIDEQADLLSNPQVTAALQSAKNCSSLSECETSRQNLTAIVDKRIDELSREAADIIK